VRGHGKICYRGIQSEQSTQSFSVESAALSTQGGKHPLSSSQIEPSPTHRVSLQSKDSQIIPAKRAWDLGLILTSGQDNSPDDSDAFQMRTQLTQTHGLAQENRGAKGL